MQGKKGMQDEPDPISKGKPTECAFENTISCFTCNGVQVELIGVNTERTLTGLEVYASGTGGAVK